jgi:anti-sigma factor RsiW
VSIEHVQEDALNMHFDGELAPSEAASVERHLASCGECTKRLHSMQRLREMIAMSADEVASQVDFDAMFGRIEQGAKAAPQPSLWERLTLWLEESLRHNPMRVWAPAGGLALAAAAALVFALKSSSPGAAGDEEMRARSGIIEEGREKLSRDKVMVAANEPPPAEPLAEANASEVVQVDFGSNTGTVFEIALADGASTPVVWINED